MPIRLAHLPCAISYALDKAPISRLTSLSPNRSGEPDAREVPTSVGGEKIAIRGPDMRERGRARSAPQHKLVGHEFAVVLPERARWCSVPRVRRIVTLRPLPHVAK